MSGLARALSWFLQPDAAPQREADRPSAVAPGGGLTSAAVLGRPGEAEPVAAALALGLARHARSRAATVAVLAAPPAGPDDAATPASAEAASSGGFRAAWRLAGRLAAHGLPARGRGRLAWVAVPVEERLASARRAVVAGAPSVLAVTAPRTADLEAVLAEQDLIVLVTAQPDGALARAAAPPAGGPPLVVVRPLRRGAARSFACAGIAAPRSLRELPAPSPEGEPT